MMRWTAHCGCQFEEDVINGKVTHTGRIYTTCAAHTSVDPLVLYNVVLTREDQPRSTLRSRLLAQFFGVLSEQAPGADVGTFQEKSGVTLAWSFSGTPSNRTIVCAISGVTLTQAQKTAAQTWADANLGVGKVVFVN